jgi:uncharacterized membrane protein YfcA
VALFAGALNSVAGGGSFFSFPALLFTGVPPIVANATNTIAVWPGSVASVTAYRKEFTAPPQLLMILASASLLGGLFGALLLLKTPESVFVGLIPYLLLLATLLFTFGGQLTAYLRSRRGNQTTSPWLTWLGVGLIQLVIATYGGYFGGGIGILMLASLSLIGMTNIHTMNALKTLLAVLINGIAVVAFILAKVVLWPQAILMIVGAVLGGYFGAYYAQRIDPRWVRWFVSLVGFGMTIYFFVR